METQHRSPSVLLRTVVIGLTAFLTVVDLFATQAILPSLTRAYHATPAAMGFAVNASTMGMAVAGLIVSVFSQHIDRRFGILVSLALLSIPTALLAIAPDLTMFTVLRIAQGVCMASAFTLTLAYLGEECSAADAGGARRSPRPGLEFLLLRDAQSRGRRARLLYGRSCGCDGANRRSRILSLRGVARAPAQFRSCAPRSASDSASCSRSSVRSLT
jgi:hypothetical protein